MEYFIGLVDFATPAYDETVGLRKKMLKSPLGIDFDLEELQMEYKDYHLACYNQSQDLIGCLVLSPLENECIKMRQVAVDTNYQRKGIGEEMVRNSEALAIKKGFQTMVLNARDTAVPFYKRLNYKLTGKPFTEVGIKHFKMEKSLIDQE